MPSDQDSLAEAVFDANADRSTLLVRFEEDRTVFIGAVNNLSLIHI